MPPGDDTRAPADFEEGQQLKDLQLAVLNILEDAAADRLRAEAAVKASVNILSRTSATPRRRSGR
jgi:hypothetical protein